jgi:hypothetical protein
MSASAPLLPQASAIFGADHREIIQTCPYCSQSFPNLSGDEFLLHTYICEESNADDWIERADGTWGRTRAPKEDRLGSVQVTNENGVLHYSLAVVPEGYCRFCGHVHASGHYCGSSSTCEKTERDSRQIFVFKGVVK